MSRIYWDTMLFVYWLEEHPRYAARIAYLLDRMMEREDTLLTSVFTLAELLVGPYMKNDLRLAQRIRQALQPPAVELIPFTSDAAERYARIRAQLTVSPADAIHLACAAEAGVDVFITNDRSLAGKVVPGIQFLVGLESHFL